MTRKVDLQMSAVSPCMKEKWHERKVFIGDFLIVWERAVGGMELPCAAEPWCHQECCVSDAD